MDHDHTPVEIKPFSAVDDIPSSGRPPLSIALASPYDYAFPGGVTAHVRALAGQLRRRGHQVDIIAPTSQPLPDSEGVVPLGVPVYALPMSGATARVSISPAVWGAVADVLRTRHYDVIHVHEPTAPPLSLAVIRHARAPVVGTFHQYRERHPYNEVAHPITRHFVAKLQARIAVSEAAERTATPYFPGTYHLIPNGVDVDFYRCATPLPQVLEHAPFNILYVGRLESRKGLRYLLEAFREVRKVLPQARLWVVGAYTKAEKLPFVRWVRHHRVHGVRFIGQVSDTEKAQWYASATVFCAPSTGYESFGMVLTEAMAAGVAVVASDIPGYREVVQHEDTALLVPPCDSRALADALLHLLCDPDSRHTLAHRAQQRVTRYDWERVTGAVERLYYETVQKTCPNPIY
jgi:phosphatidylinositol alpha-mannosyltransferase